MDVASFAPLRRRRAYSPPYTQQQQNDARSEHSSRFFSALRILADFEAPLRLVGYTQIMSSGLYVACFIFAIAVGTAPPGITPVLVFPAHAGDSVRYHVTRTTQAADGTQAKTIDVTIVRKAPTTAALSRTNANGRTDLTVLPHRLGRLDSNPCGRSSRPAGRRFA